MKIGRDEHGDCAAHTGCRAIVRDQRRRVALMSEAVGMAGMIETPIVCIDVQRAGPATGVPTKTNKAISGKSWALARAIIGASLSRRRTSWIYFRRFRSCSIL